VAANQELWWIVLASPAPDFDDSGMIETSQTLRFAAGSRWLRLTQASLCSFLAIALFWAGTLDLSAGDGGGSAGSQDQVPLQLKLPPPAFVGTPQNIPVGSDVEPMSTKPRPPMLVPADVRNLAPASQITCSDTNKTADALAKIVDGDKRATDASVVNLRKGTQFVQFDLGARYQLYAIVIWHAHDTAKVYHDVIVQLSDDPSFKGNVRTLFNNDKDDSSERGVGTDREYFETYEGKLIDAKGVPARYVRTYSHGSSESALNEYTEVEIYGRPPK
jgi:hypothetical protein